MIKAPGGLYRRLLQSGKGGVQGRCVPTPPSGRRDAAAVEFVGQPLDRGVPRRPGLGDGGPEVDPPHEAVAEPALPLGGENADAVIAALNRHKGFLRGQMGHMISTKFTPDLRFVEDQSFAEAEKIENLLKSPQVQRDLVASEEDDETDE